MTTIAIIEDDIGLNNGIALALKNEKYDILQYYTLKEAKDALKVTSLSLIILDINLPDGNGYEFLKKLRSSSEIPVIILTANDLETDEVMGLELGADDYITKPFSLMVLRARIENVLKKAEGRKNHIICIDDFLFDFEQLEFKKSGRVIEFSKTEQKLLRLLIENRGRTLTRELLIDRIWTDGEEYVDENALSVTVKRVRDKLEEQPSTPVYIQTVYGIGYVWRVN